MKGIIIDTSCNRSYLILVESGNPIEFVPMDGGESLSRSLGRRIQNLLDQHSSFRAEFVAIGRGPGSYTGTRVGVAMAKALAFGWNIPLVGFCSLQAFISPQMGRFAILIDARMGGCYCLQGERTKTAVHLQEPFLLKSILELPDHEHLLSPHPADIQKRLSISRPIQEAHPDISYLSAECCRKAHEEGQNPLALFPIAYLC